LIGRKGKGKGGVFGLHGGNTTGMLVVNARLNNNIHGKYHWPREKR
jgi:hypothetical protein